MLALASLRWRRGRHNLTDDEERTSTTFRQRGGSARIGRVDSAADVVLDSDQAEFSAEIVSHNPRGVEPDETKEEEERGQAKGWWRRLRARAIRRSPRGGDKNLRVLPRPLPLGESRPPGTRCLTSPTLMSQWRVLIIGLKAHHRTCTSGAYTWEGRQSLPRPPRNRKRLSRFGRAIREGASTSSAPPPGSLGSPIRRSARSATPPLRADALRSYQFCVRQGLCVHKH